jgi:type I restriction-modification system DNA methylase subunit
MCILVFKEKKNNNNSSPRSNKQYALSSKEHQQIDSKCKMCYKAEENTKRIVAGCTTFAPSEYTNRRNKVAGYIHWSICKHMGLQVTDKYYEHISERII